MNPFVSIIVPTRERCDTLESTLKTLVTQDYSNAEFIVCDNASTDQTSTVVKSFQDNRIIYVRTPHRLSMSDNWDYALKYASGEYITFIGDDDGFLPNSISLAMQIIKNTSVKALSWRKVEFFWPDFPDTSLASRLIFPLQESLNVSLIKSNTYLPKVLNNLSYQGYTSLPCLYNSLVRRDVIQEILDINIRKNFFYSISPDIFSAISISAYLDSYAFTTYPITINGASRHSNGSSHLRNEEKQVNSPAYLFQSENKLKYLSDLDKIDDIVKKSIIMEYINVRTHFPQLDVPIPLWWDKDGLNDFFYKNLLTTNKSENVYFKKLHYYSARITSKIVRTFLGEHYSKKNNEFDNSVIPVVNLKTNPKIVKTVYDASIAVTNFVDSDALLDKLNDSL